MLHDSHLINNKGNVRVPPWRAKQWHRFGKPFIRRYIKWSNRQAWCHRLFIPALRKHKQKVLSLSSQSDWSTYGLPGQPGLHNERDAISEINKQNICTFNFQIHSRNIYVFIYYMKMCIKYVIINVNDRSLKKRMLTLMVSSFLYFTKYGICVHVYACVYVCNKWSWW